MTGSLVVEDGTLLRKDIPTLQFSDFETIIKQSNIETYRRLIHPQMPPLPFGFIFGPRLEKGASSGSQFIVPAEVMERRDVQAWRFDLKEWQRNPRYGSYWFYVTRAEPLQARQ